jgi:hypothetical protein
MEQEYIMRGLRQVAEAEGETVEKVMAEIAKIIDICWNSTDPLRGMGIHSPERRAALCGGVDGLFSWSGTIR